MNIAAAISLFWRPAAACSAIACSVAVRSSRDATRPLTRASSARALSAHGRASRESNSAIAAPSVSRADHPRAERWFEGLSPYRIAGDAGERRTRQGRCLQKHIRSRRGQLVQALVERLAEVRGKPPVTAARELEGEERVASRRLVDPHEIGTREIHPDAIAQEPVCLAESERRHANFDDAILAEERGGLERWSHPRCVPDAHEQRDARATQTPERDPQDARRRGVEPLEVVDRDEEVGIGRQEREHVEHRQPDRFGLGRRGARILEQQRHAQGPQPGRREVVLDLGENRADEIGDPREREPRLGLHGSMDEHARAARDRLVDAALPEDRLADARVAPQHERLEIRSREELPQAVKLRLPSDNGGGGHGLEPGLCRSR